ncbi:YeaC family protein [Aestuariirhabdus sp. LZHN29]|uniref:YeaC family protein n=1 Tax=Aestuariirhabdus sp. LZHN29 TaxID=3417462 RepID=UPI003CEF73CC
MSADGMTFEQLLGSITPEVYQNLRRAVELGKWPNGRKLTSEQRLQCMQAMIAWEKSNLPEEQHSGYMEQQCKSLEKQIKELEPQPLNFTRH